MYILLLHMTFYINIYIFTYLCTYVYAYFFVCTCICTCVLFRFLPTCSIKGAESTMGWLRLVGFLKLQVSFAKESYKRDDILQMRPMSLRSLLIVGTHMCAMRCMTHLDIGHDSSICETWLIYVCSKYVVYTICHAGSTINCVSCQSTLYVTPGAQSIFRPLLRSFFHHLVLTKQISSCGILDMFAHYCVSVECIHVSPVSHDSFVCVTWLIHVSPVSPNYNMWSKNIFTASAAEKKTPGGNRRLPGASCLSCVSRHVLCLTSCLVSHVMSCVSRLPGASCLSSVWGRILRQVKAFKDYLKNEAEFGDMTVLENSL